MNEAVTNEALVLESVVRGFKLREICGFGEDWVAESVGMKAITRKGESRAAGGVLCISGRYINDKS